MKFSFSGNMLRFVDHNDEVSVDGATVAEGIARLVESYPDLRPVLYDGQGQLRAIHRIFLNGDLLQRSDVGRAVGQDAEISVLTPIAGG